LARLTAQDFLPNSHRADALACIVAIPGTVLLLRSRLFTTYFYSGSPDASLLLTAFVVRMPIAKPADSPEGLVLSNIRSPLRCTVYGLSGLRNNGIENCSIAHSFIHSFILRAICRRAVVML